MGSKVNVASIERLREFSLQYRYFANALAVRLGELECDLQRRLEQLEEALRCRSQRIRELGRIYEEEGDERSRLLLAARIQEAVEEMTRINGLVNEVREQYYKFRQAARRVQQFLEQQAPKAVSFLESVVQHLDTYVAVSLPHPASSQPPPGFAGGGEVKSEDSQLPRSEPVVPSTAGSDSQDEEHQKCPVCAGRGTIRRVAPFKPEMFEVMNNLDFKQPCPLCRGSGKLPKR